MKDLPQSLWPTIAAERVEFADSLSAGFEKSLEENYDLCFLSARLTQGIESFFNDMKTLGRIESCKFIQLGPGRGELSLHPAISLIVSNPLTDNDRARLSEILKSELFRRAAAEKSEEVREVVHLLLKELELGVQDRRRGRNSPLNRVMGNFVRSHTAFDPSVLESYLDALSSNAEKVDPSPQDFLAVPDEVLKRKLPHLEKASYAGVSRRVWSRMIRRFKDNSKRQKSENSEETPLPNTQD